VRLTAWTRVTWQVAQALSGASRWAVRTPWQLRQLSTTARLTRIRSVPALWQAAHARTESAPEAWASSLACSAWVNRRFPGRARAGGLHSTSFSTFPSWHDRQFSAEG